MGLVNSIINFWVPQNTGYIFTGRLDTRGLKRTLLCGVTRSMLFSLFLHLLVIFKYINKQYSVVRSQ